MESIKRAIELKVELDKLRPLSKDDELRIMQKFRLDWNYHSSNIEGNSLTYGETKALILFGTTASGKPLKDHFEMTGHNEAINWIIDIIKEERPLTENFIRQLHEILLKEEYWVDAITPEGEPSKKLIKVGSYKETANHVKTQTGEIFRFATPEETPAKMQELVEWYRTKENEKDIEPILIAAEFHYKFIRIHPFDDGNGRLARILMNFILMRHAYPPVVVKTNDKENYFSVLRQADVGNIDPFFDYIALNLIHSLEIMTSGAKGDSIEEKDDIDKEIALLWQRVESTSNSLGIQKSKEVILNIIDNSLTSFLKSIFEQSEKFKIFYKNFSMTAKFDNQNMGLASPDKIIDSIRNNKLHINDDFQSLTIKSEFKNFKKKGFGNLKFAILVQIKFEDFNYKINTLPTTKELTKKYNDLLNKSEMVNILKVFKETHMNQIDSAVEDFNKKSS